MQVDGFFQKLGFGEDESSILAFLTGHSKQGVLQIARSTGIERTKVYRIIDKLLSEGYVIQIKDYRKNYYSIGSISKFLERKDQELKKAESLINSWPEFVRVLTDGSANVSTDVRYYRGKEGIKQILWNELSTKEILSFTYRNLLDVVGEKWFKSWAKECDRRGIIVKDLRTKSFDVFEEEKGFNKVPVKGDIVKYLPPSYEDFHLAVDVYDDIVVLYDWRDNDVFAVEIQNRNFAKFLRMIFYDLWEKAKSRKN